MPLWSVTFPTHRLVGDTPVHGTQTWVLEASCPRDALLLAAARTQSESARRHRRYATADTSTGHTAVWRSGDFLINGPVSTPELKGPR